MLNRFQYNTVIQHFCTLFCPHHDMCMYFSFISSLGTLNYIWNSLGEVRTPRTRFKSQEPGRCGIDSSITWVLNFAQPTRQVSKWEKGGTFCWRIWLRWVSRERKWINLLLPQRLMENIHALLSIAHCIKDVAKLLNKVIQLWGDFWSMFSQILSPAVASQTLQGESTKLVTRNSGAWIALS